MGIKKKLTNNTEKLTPSKKNRKINNMFVFFFLWNTIYLSLLIQKKYIYLFII